MSLWQKVQSWFTSDKNRFRAPVFEPGHVDVAYDDAEIDLNTSYCRIWLDRMRLARTVEWVQDRYPIVHAAIRYDYAGKTLTVPKVAGVDFFKQLTEQNLDRVLTQSVPLSPLFPYKSGLVEVQAGLFSMRDSDQIGAAVKTLGRFSDMLGAPAFSKVLDIVDPLYSGIEDLFDAGESRLELGYQQTFAPKGSKVANTFRPGYFAVIYDPKDELKVENLRIVKGDIHASDGKGATRLLTGFSYMLLRVERRGSQDWENLAEICELVERAQDAMIAGKQEEARQILPAIKVAIARSPDIVREDRPPMYAKIEAEMRDLGLQGRHQEVAKRSLSAIMHRPETVPDEETEQAAWDALTAALIPLTP